MKIISISNIMPRNKLFISLESMKNYLNNIIYYLMQQLLVHHGKNSNLKSSKIIGGTISTSSYSIIPCEDCEI